MPDLWPQDLGDSTVTPPVSILREQAEALGKKTSGLVTARVQTTAAGDKLHHSFYLEVPSLDDYTYRLFGVEHPMELFPAVIYLDAAGGQKYVSENYEMFLANLRDVFNHPKVKKIIVALKAQAQPEQQAGNLPF